jgi:membrane protease YdiL (CAAX protease family)
VTGAGLLAVHTLVGVPLSFYWRRSGNLLVPGVSHAMLDAIRDAFFMT